MRVSLMFFSKMKIIIIRIVQRKDIYFLVFGVPFKFSWLYEGQSNFGIKTTSLKFLRTSKVPFYWCSDSPCSGIRIGTY